MKNMKNLINNFTKKVRQYLKEKYLTLSKKISTSYERCKEGEEKLNTILFYWSLIPCLLYIFIRIRYIFVGILAFLLDLAFFILGFLDYYFISKTLEKHPEYDTEKMEKIKKAEYYSSLSDEEYENVRKKEKQEELRSNVKGILFARSWKKRDLYKGVKVFLILIMLVTFKRLFLK
jgi:hypothetical protein